MTIAANPVVGRELTERLRGFRAYLAVSVFVWVLALAMYLIFEASAGTANQFDLSARTGAGRMVFESTILIMTVLILFFVPALTSGAIAGERERQTLATLQVTLLRTRSILIGKVVAALVFLLLMVVAAFPVLAVSYLLGGIRLIDIFMGVLAVLIVAVLVATMVVAVSSLAKRVQSATLIAYGFTAVLTGIGPVAYLIGSLIDARTPADGRNAPAWMLTVNPLTIVADLGSGNRTEGDGPLSTIRGWLASAKARNDASWWAWFPKRVNFTRVTEALNGGRPVGAGPPAWLLAVVWLSLLAAVLVLFAVRRLRTPAKVER